MSPSLPRRKTPNAPDESSAERRARYLCACPVGPVEKFCLAALLDSAVTGGPQDPGYITYFSAHKGLTMGRATHLPFMRLNGEKPHATYESGAESPGEPGSRGPRISYVRGRGPRCGRGCGGRSRHLGLPVRAHRVSLHAKDGATGQVARLQLSLLNARAARPRLLGSARGASAGSRRHASAP
jgi:hypothetical protein